MEEAEAAQPRSHCRQQELFHTKFRESDIGVFGAQATTGRLGEVLEKVQPATIIYYHSLYYFNWEAVLCLVSVKALPARV